MKLVRTVRLGRRGTQGVVVDEQIARHEAAHVLVALAAGGTVAEIDLVPTMHADASVPTTWPNAMSPVEREWGALQVSLAGRVVDLAGGQHEVASRHDVLNAMVIVAGILSAGQRPASLDGPLTVEDVIGEASTAAAVVLARHLRLLEKLTTTLVRVGAVRITGGLLASLTAHMGSQLRQPSCGQGSGPAPQQGWHPGGVDCGLDNMGGTRASPPRT